MFSHTVGGNCVHASLAPCILICSMWTMMKKVQLTPYDDDNNNMDAVLCCFVTWCQCEMKADWNIMKSQEFLQGTWRHTVVGVWHVIMLPCAHFPGSAWGPEDNTRLSESHWGASGCQRDHRLGRTEAAGGRQTALWLSLAGDAEPCHTESK